MFLSFLLKQTAASMSNKVWNTGEVIALHCLTKLQQFCPFPPSCCLQKFEYPFPLKTSVAQELWEQSITICHVKATPIPLSLDLGLKTIYQTFSHKQYIVQSDFLLFSFLFLFVWLFFVLFCFVFFRSFNRTVTK